MKSIVKLIFKLTLASIPLMRKNLDKFQPAFAFLISFGLVMLLLGIIRPGLLPDMESIKAAFTEIFVDMP